MLQQTQVATVMPYYTRFLKRFPSIEHLAEASIDDVMKAWEGLGYYSRARHLHETARIIRQRYHGKFPVTLDQLLELPGIGRYTAGAILSIAFNKHVPIVDGNIIRLLTRVFHVTESVGLSTTQKTLWETAESLLPRKRVSDFNQGLMELGALLCTPKNPKCPACPIRKQCEAYKLSIQQELPVKPARKPVPHYDVTAAVIWDKDRFLITKRPPHGLLGGLWEFPGGKQERGESLESCLKREIREELAIDIDVCDLLIEVKHAYTHFKITLHVFQCMYRGGVIEMLGCTDFRWIQSNELDQYAFPAADHKVIKLLKDI